MPRTPNACAPAMSRFMLLPTITVRGLSPSPSPSSSYARSNMRTSGLHTPISPEYTRASSKSYMPVCRCTRSNDMRVPSATSATVCPQARRCSSASRAPGISRAVSTSPLASKVCEPSSIRVSPLSMSIISFFMRLSHFQPPKQRSVNSATAPLNAASMGSA